MATLRASHVLPLLALVSLVRLLILENLYPLSPSTFPAIVGTNRAHPTPSFSFKNITLVDVRKSGGKHLKRNFQVFCSNCTVQNSTISHLTTGYLHTRGPQPSEAALRDADAFLYNLRHPIDRVLAWHHFEHPYSCIDDNTTFNACRTMEAVDESPGGLAGQFYIDCFPTPDLLPMAFQINNSLVTPKCSKLAHRVFNDKMPFVWGFTQTPFKFDLRYFVKVTIDVYPHTKSVLVLRSESLWDDLNNLERQLGGSKVFKTIQDPNMETDMLVNGTNYGPVCCEMIDEMRAYRKLLLLSVNLDGASKEKTLSRAVEKCNFATWREMEDSCQQQRDAYLRSLSWYTRIASAFTK